MFEKSSNPSLKTYAEVFETVAQTTEACQAGHLIGATKQRRATEESLLHQGVSRANILELFKCAETDYDLLQGELNTVRPEDFEREK